MKRISSVDRFKLLRIVRKKALAVARRINRKRPRAKRTPAFRSGISVRIAAPRTFSLTPEHAPRLLRFIRSLRDAILKDRASLELDFTYTEKMISDGTLLFVAELHRCILLTGGRIPITLKMPRNPKVGEVLKQVGVLELLKLDIEVTPTSDDVIHWCSAHGRKADGAQAGGLLDRVQGKIADPLRRGLYEGITEAMTNASEHAYIGPRDDGHPKPAEVDWWLFSQEKDGWLSVILCDLGVGIPRSLPKTTEDTRHLHRKVLALRNHFNRDVRLIKLALEIGRSRTELTHRGYGLFRNIKGAIDRNKGELAITSNRGRYEFSKTGGNAPDRSRATMLPESIGGTIISWNVPLATEESTS